MSVRDTSLLLRAEGCVSCTDVSEAARTMEDSETRGVGDMTVTDQHHRVDPVVEARLRHELAGATWFQLASATSQAHHALDDARRGHDHDAVLHALDRHTVLEHLLAEATEQLHPPA